VDHLDALNSVANLITLGYATPSNKTRSPTLKNSPEQPSYKSAADDFNPMSNFKPEINIAKSTFAFGNNNLSSTATLLPRLELPELQVEDRSQ